MNFASMANVHGTGSGAISSLIVVAAVGLVCGFSAGGDAVIYFARPAAGFSLIVALLLVCSVVRFERRQQPGERHE